MIIIALQRNGMTFQKFLEKVEETRFPICIKKVMKKEDKTFTSAEEEILISFPNDSVDLFVSPDSVSDIKEFHVESTSEDVHFWTISFKCKGLADLSVKKPVDAVILIHETNPDFQAIKSRWEGWNC